MEIDKYGQFVVDIWFSKSVEDVPMFDSNPDLKSLAIMAMGLAGETGEVQEHLKKFLRDGTLDRLNLLKELGDALYYLVRIMRYFDIQPSHVIDANVAKLNDRLARNVMHGSGDNR